MYSKRRSKRPKNPSTNRDNNHVLSQTIKHIKQVITITIIIIIVTTTNAKADTEPTQNINYENKTFNGEFFVTYAKETLKDKFPFDIMGTSPNEGNDQCPKVNLYNNEIELCILRDAINALKIPFQIAIVIIFYQKI
jgi:hypothetical protein